MLDRGSIPVGCDERVERLHQMPGRTINPRLVARMSVALRAAPPALARRDQLEFYHTLRAQIDRDFTARILRRKRHEHAAAALQGRENFRSPDHLQKMRRTYLFLAFSHKHQIDRQLLAGAANGV